MKLPTEPSDPKLKEAMAEIQAVLRKHDIAGIVLLQSPTHGEWMNEITPTWSCAMLDGDRFRFRAIAAEYGGAAERNEAIRITAGMLISFRDGAKRIQENMEKVGALLSQKMQIEHVTRFDR